MSHSSQRKTKYRVPMSTGKRPEGSMTRQKLCMSGESWETAVGGYTIVEEGRERTYVLETVSQDTDSTRNLSHRFYICVCLVSI